MKRRLFWFVFGAVTGASIVIWVKRTILSVSEKLTAAVIAEALVAGFRRGLMTLSDGVMSLIDTYRNRDASPSSSMSTLSPSDASTRRHNPPRQRTSHR